MCLNYEYLLTYINNKIVRKRANYAWMLILKEKKHVSNQKMCFGVKGVMDCNHRKCGEYQYLILKSGVDLVENNILNLLKSYWRAIMGWLEYEIRNSRTTKQIL